MVALKDFLSGQGIFLNYKRSLHLVNEYYDLGI